MLGRVYAHAVYLLSLFVCEKWIVNLYLADYSEVYP